MNLLKNILIAGLGVVAIVYLINPTLGVLELLPDNLPIVGNIDEGLATTVLLAVLRHYGLDVTRLLSRDTKAVGGR